jgi:hypothetical protein
MEGARDGDVFDVTLTNARGRKLVDVHQPVTYTVSYPNGSPQCGRCMQAVVDKT